MLMAWMKLPEKSRSAVLEKVPTEAVLAIMPRSSSVSSSPSSSTQRLIIE